VLSATQRLPQVSKKRLDFWLTHVLGMNPSTRAIAMKAQELLDPPLVGRNGARSQALHFARGFVLCKELHLGLLPRKNCSINSRV
jgi:hypothetical protein